MIRVATRDDADALGEVMHDAVRHGASRYTEAQRIAWMPRPRRGAEWTARLDGQHVVLDEGADDVRGFMSLEDGAYIDFAYIRPAHQGTGLFRRLFAAIRAEAERGGAGVLRTHASLTAEPAFAAMGFEVVRRETVALGGERLERAEMAMALGDQTARRGDSGPLPR